jgi:hypothetical protein
MTDAVFSNGAEWEIWSDHWCFRPCKKDRNEDCVHILAALCGARPAAWVDAPDRQKAHGRYICTDFELDEGEDHVTGDGLGLPAGGPYAVLYSNAAPAQRPGDC